MSLYEYVIIYTAIDYFDQTSVPHRSVIPPLPPPKESAGIHFNERGRKSKRSSPLDMSLPEGLSCD